MLWAYDLVMTCCDLRSGCAPPRALLAALVAVALSGCAGGSVDSSTFFVDPARYDLYDCTQLDTARKAAAARTAELQGLMAKAEQGAAGSIVSVVAYQSEYTTSRANMRLADDVWRRNNCGTSQMPAPRSSAPVR